MTRDELRAAMPTVAAIVDEYRHLMAKGGKLVYASENGHVIDRREREDEAKVFTVPHDYRKPPGGFT
jgi:hypothetical protein